MRPDVKNAHMNDAFAFSQLAEKIQKKKLLGHILTTIKPKYVALVIKNNNVNRHITILHETKSVKIMKQDITYSIN